MTREELDKLTIEWFNKIATLAENRKTNNGDIMTPMHTLDEIHCLALRCVSFIENHKNE